MITSKNNERAYGIDLLKTLAMFMVVVLHVLDQGGILKSTTIGSASFFVSRFIDSSALCAVNAFALATGFLMVGRKIKYRKIIGLWLIVEFYSVLYFLLDIIFFQSGMGTKLSRFVPVFTNQYWYFTAYVCLFLFIPFLNVLIESLSKNQLYVILITGFLLFSVAYVVFTVDTFKLVGGYCAWWLIYLYFVGAAIKKYGLFLKIPTGIALLGYFISVMLTFFIRCLPSLTYSTAILAQITSFFSKNFSSYLSPTVLASAIFLLVFCMKVNMPSFLKRSLSKVQPLIFQVYIIHQHSLPWNLFMKNRFADYGSKPAALLIVYVLGTALCIFLICLFVDFLRNLLFKFLRVNKILDIMANKCYAGFQGSRLKNLIGNFWEKHIGF